MNKIIIIIKIILKTLTLPFTIHHEYYYDHTCDTYNEYYDNNRNCNSCYIQFLSYIYDLGPKYGYSEKGIEIHTFQTLIIFYYTYGL